MACGDPAAGGSSCISSSSLGCFQAICFPAWLTMAERDDGSCLSIHESSFHLRKLHIESLEIGESLQEITYENLAHRVPGIPSTSFDTSSCVVNIAAR